MGLGELGKHQTMKQLSQLYGGWSLGYCHLLSQAWGSVISQLETFSGVEGRSSGLL